MTRLRLPFTPMGSQVRALARRRHVRCPRCDGPTVYMVRRYECVNGCDTNRRHA
jgi:hypothetical protein